MSQDKKIVLVNGCDLLNRHELSNSQEQKLQRYIDESSHLLRYKYADEPQPKPSKQQQPSRYASIVKQLKAGGHESLKTSENSSSLHNLTNFSPPIPFGYRKGEESSKPYDQTLRIDIPKRSRKEVKWSDTLTEPLIRVQSLTSLSSPNQFKYPNQMSQYGSVGNLSGQNDAHRTFSPGLLNAGKAGDDYNRYETAKHRSTKAQNCDERSRFAGYGDRPGSGIEFLPQPWHGGEIIPDRQHLPKSLQPKRMYYSPIGDGVVAADGIEMKHSSRDTSPRISVSHYRTYDRGEPGGDGYNIYERVTHGSDRGSDYGIGSGRNSGAAETVSPGGGYGTKGFDPRGMSPGYGYGSKGFDPRSMSPGDGYGPKGFDSRGMSPGGYNAASSRKSCDAGLRDPYSTLGSTRSDPLASYAGRTGSHDRDFDHSNDGRRSGDQNTTFIETSRFDNRSEGRRYEVQTDYLITNPHELIHQYATTTPIVVLGTNDPLTKSSRTMYESTTEERFAPYAPYKCTDTLHPKNFIRKLRDENLTSTQKQANLCQDPLNRKPANYESRVSEMQYRAQHSANSSELDHLTEKLIQGLQTGHPTPPRFN